MNFYNLDTVKNINIDYPDLYFTPEYGKACEYSDNSIWELCKFKDLIYVYLKQPIEYNNKTYYDLITPYGYSGYYYENKETYNEFLPLFRKKALEKNYLTEVVRQNPYINIELSNYNVITSKILYSINTNKELELKDKSHRNAINKAIKNNLKFTINMDIDNFKFIYEDTMKHLNSNKYYYFNESYYKNLNNYFIANVYYDNILCASCIIFKYNNFLHYHIGGSLLEYRKYGCNNFLHYKVSKYAAENNYQYYILGCGLKDGDSLSKFKKKLSNKEFNYIIYKNILNKEIYDKLSENIKLNDFFPGYKYK